MLKYRPPKEYLELKEDGTDLFDDELYKPSGPDGRGWGEFRKLTEEERIMEDRDKKLAELAEDRTEKVYQNIQEIKNKKYFLDEDERVNIFI